MAVVGTAYVHIKALANNMAKDIEESLQPLSQSMQRTGQEAGQNFAESFNKSVDSNSNDTSFNPAEGLSEKIKPELEELEKEFQATHERLQKDNRTALDKLAQNFKNTGRKSSNNFIQNFGMGMWFQLIHRMYDLFLFITPAIGVAGGAITQLVGGLYSMIGAMGSAVNVTAVLPGIFYALGGSLIATNIGLKDSAKASSAGFDAMKALATGASDADAKMLKYKEALKGLGPEARKFTETLVGMSGTFMDISSNIQSKLLPPLTDALKVLERNNVIDAFGASFAELGGVVGQTGLDIAKLTDSPLFRGRLNTVFESSSKVAGFLGDALTNMVTVLVNVAAAAAPVTEAFASWIETVTGDWAKRSTDNFQGLSDAISKGADRFKILWTVVKNLWSTLTGLGKAGDDAGKKLWYSFQNVTKEWSDFVNSVEGQDALKDFFENAADGARAIGDIFRALGRVLVDFAGNANVVKALEGVTPMVEQLGDMINRMVDEAGPALGEMMQSLLDLLDTITEGQGVSAFAGTITLFADALSGLLNLPGGHNVLIFLASFIGIFKAGSIIAQVTGFRGAVSGLFKTLGNVKTSGGFTSWIRGVNTQMKNGNKVTTGYASGFTGSMRMVASSAKTGLTNAGKGFANFGRTLGGAAVSVGKGAGRIGVSMKDGLKNSVRGIDRVGVNMGTQIRSGLVSSGKGIKGAASSAASGVSGAFVAAGTKSKNAMNKAGSAMKSGFGKTMGALGKMNPFGAILMAVELLLPVFLTLYASSETFRNSVNGAFSAIGDAIKPIMPVLQGLLDNVISVFSGIMESVGPPLMDAFSSIASALGPVLGTIGKTLGDVFSSVGPVLTDMASQLGPIFSTMGSSIGGVFQQLGPVISQIVSQIGPLAAQILPMLGQAFGQIMSAVTPLLPMLAELVGGVLTTLGGLISQLVPIFGQWIGMVVSLGSSVLSALLPALSQIVSSVLPVLMTAIKAIFPLFTTIISVLLPPLINLFQTVLPAVINALLPVIQTVIGAIIPIIVSVVQILIGVITFLTGVFTGNWSAAWDGIKTIFQGIWNLIVNIVKGVFQIIWSVVVAGFTLISSAVTTALSAISGFFSTIWNGILTFIKSVVTSIVSFFVQSWTNLKNNTAAIFNAVKATITSVINGIRSVVNSVITWVVNFFVKSWNNLKNNTVNAFNAIKNGITNALNSARNVVSSVINGIRNTISGAWNTVKSLTSNTWNSFKNTISSGVNGAMNIVRGIPGRIRSAFGNAGSMLRDVGSNIISGLVNGIKSGISRVTSAARNVAKAAVNAAKSALGIQSPSKIFKDIGGFVGSGFVKGLQGTQSSVSKASAELSKKVESAFKAKAISKKTYNNTQKLIKSSNTKMLDLAKKREQVAAKYKAAQEKLTEAIKIRNDYSDQVRESMIGTLDLGGIGKNSSFDSILNKFKDSTKMVKDFQANLKKLKSMGLEEDLYKQIVSAGAERGSELAKSLTQNGAAGISQINQEYRNLVTASSGVGSDASNYLYGAGVDVAKGLVNGLKSQEKALAKQAEKMANTIAKAIKKALKIKSPSRVLMEIGEMTAQGLVKGLQDMSGAVEKSAESMGKSAIDGTSKGVSGLRTIPNMKGVYRGAQPPPAFPTSADLSGSIVTSSSEQNPVLTPQNQALVRALSEHLKAPQTNYFNIQKERSIQELAVAISRELERTR